MPLGLVSYGSSDSEESDNESENETQEPPKPKIEAVKKVEGGEISDEDEVIPAKNDQENLEQKSVIETGEISDEEEIIPSVLDDNDITEDIPGLSSSTSLLNSLPSISSSETPSTSKDFVDENEDLSTIPKAKIYSEKPDLKAIKPKKKKGPIRIMAPSLNSIDDADDEKETRPVVRAPSTKKSGLFGMLPPPKNSLQASSTSSVTTTPAPSSSKPSSKPSLMVPRSVSKKPVTENKKTPVVSKNQGNDSDEEDVPFFTMDAASKVKDKDIAHMKMNVKANPEALHPRGIEPGSHPSHQFRYDEDQVSDYSAVTAPYPPPPPEPRSSNGNGPMQPSQEALQRLAGAASKRRKLEEEGFNQIIDVNFDDIKPDEREWLTKALTEDDADKPGPKNTIKGERKTKHQITWLAAEAKQNENKLKKQWAESASNKRAAGNKYGF